MTDEKGLNLNPNYWDKEAIEKLKIELEQKEKRNKDKPSIAKGTKSKEDETEIIQTSLIDIDGKIYEETFDEEHGAIFVSLNDKGEPESDNLIECSDVSYVAIHDEAIETGAVLLPTKTEEYGEIKDLVSGLETHFKKYTDLPTIFYIISAYYVLLSWVYDKFNTIPYLRFLGDTGTGKSRCLDVIGRICYKACIVSGCINPAPLYRMIKRWRGTLIIDEADLKFSDQTNEVIKILNCGFEKGRPVIRCRSENYEELEFLPTFCPKIIATRFTFNDKALESRCLTEKMTETSRVDIPSILPKTFYEEEMTLRNKLLMFRLRWLNKINTDEAKPMELGDVEPRLRQAVSAFASLSSNIPELESTFKDFMSSYSKDLIEERSNTLEGLIVATIIDLKKANDNISSSDILEEINIDKSSKLDAKRVGRILKSLNITTKSTRFNGKVKRFIIWDQSLMEILKKRYVPDEDTPHDTDATNETTLQKPDSVASVSNVSSLLDAVDNATKNDINQLKHLREDCKNNILEPRKDFFYCMECEADYDRSKN